MRSPLLQPRDLVEPPVKQVFPAVRKLIPTLTDDDYLAMLGAEATLIVDELCIRRRRVLAAWNATHPTTTNGRILFSAAPTEMVFDGVSQAESRGFFDEHDLPPWDLWLGYGRDPADNRWKLVAWVPAEYVGDAQRGIDVNAFECLSWGDSAAAQWCVADVRS